MGENKKRDYDILYRYTSPIVNVIIMFKLHQ